MGDDLDDDELEALGLLANPVSDDEKDFGDEDEEMTVTQPAGADG